MLVFISTVVTLLLTLMGMFARGYKWKKLLTVINPSIDPTGAGYTSSMDQSCLDVGICLLNMKCQFSLCKH